MDWRCSTGEGGSPTVRYFTPKQNCWIVLLNAASNKSTISLALRLCTMQVISPDCECLPVLRLPQWWDENNPPQPGRVTLETGLCSIRVYSFLCFSFIEQAVLVLLLTVNHPCGRLGQLLCIVALLLSLSRMSFLLVF